MSGTMMDNKPPSADPDSPVLGRAPSPVQAERGSAAVGDESNAEVIPPGSPLTNRSQRKSPLRDVFVGPDGIYSLPRLLIYVAMAWLVFQVETWLVVSIQPHLGPFWWQMAVEATMMLAAIAPAFIMVRIERRPFEDFGLPAGSAFRGNFWAGALWGIVSLSVLMVVLRVVGVFEFGGLALHGVRIWKFAAYYAVLFLITGFFEEFLMRGYSQWVLARGINFWPAAVFLSIAFGSIHGRNPGETTTGLVAAGCIGFFLCLTLRRTGNLWWAVGFHMAWDWGESYLYSVPDSGTLLPGHLLNSSLHGPDWLTGGSVGPEGSYLVFVVIAALWFAFDRVYPDVRYGESHPNVAKSAT
jgi:membrane protease YdiL (CAAX protease family)